MVECCILELVTWLHHLISLVRYRDNGHKPLPTSSPTRKESKVYAKNLKLHKYKISIEDKNLLEEVMKRRKPALGLSKSQEFGMVKTRKNKGWSLSRSTGSSPHRELNHPKADALDILDGLDSTFLAPRHDLIWSIHYFIWFVLHIWIWATLYILLVCILIFSSRWQSYCIDDEHTAVVLLDDIQTKSLPRIVGNVELFYAFASAHLEF